MTNRLWLIGAAAFIFAACNQSSNADSAASASAAPEAASAHQDADVLESTAASGAYTPDPNHHYITFSYFHQGFSHPWIRWRNWTGALNWDAEVPENSSVNVVIDAASVDSGVDVFDGHLKSEKHFDVSQFPEITFDSTAVEKTGVNTGKIVGDLTIRGITKPVTLDVVFNKGVYDERGNRNRLGFSAKTTVARSDFGLDFLVPSVSDEVSIVIETEWTMSGPETE